MRLWRYCLAGFLFNWLGFVFWFVVPIRAVAFGASSTELALLQTASTVFYVVNSIVMGRLSDRISRSLLARISTVGAIASAVLIARADSLRYLYLVVPLMGLAGGVYWPSIQGAVGAESGPAQVEKTIGWFNVSWSIGKTLGFVGAGWLVYTRGHEFTLWIAAGAALPILLLYPSDRADRWDHLPAEEAAVDRVAFRTIGYIANFLAFGVGTVFSTQFFKYLEALPQGVIDREAFFGIFMGTIYASQTLIFVLLQRGRAWTYRRTLLYGAQLVAGSAAAAVTLLGGAGPLLGLAALVGVGLGFSNASSIYYSLHGPSDHGKYAGVHEAVLGSGTILVPLAGGLLADHFHDLRMPYWLAAGATLVAVAVQEGVYLRRPRS